MQAVRYATLHAPKSDLFYRYGAYGEPDAEVEMAYYFWLLRAGGETIVVDTGFDPAAGARRGRTCLRAGRGAAPDRRRARVGLDGRRHALPLRPHREPRRVPAATLIVPRRELEFWTSPMAARFQFASHVEAAEIEFVAQAAADGRVRLTEGTEEILDGVTAIDVGGHSPGQQVTVVRSAAATSCSPRTRCTSTRSSSSSGPSP